MTFSNVMRREPMTRQPNSQTKRLSRIAGYALVVAGVPALTACVFAYDSPKPSIVFRNDLDEAVVVVIEGESMEIPSSVSAMSANEEPQDECAGTSIRVESPAGVVWGRVDGQACPGWLLTIHADGSLDYAEAEAD